MKLIVSAAALAIGLAAGAAHAAPAADGKPAPRQIGMIKAMDTDGDGKVSKAEFLAFQPKRQAAAAADGQITREEFMKRGPIGHRAGAGPGPERKARMEERRAEIFKTIDKDGNGSISREEFMDFQGGMMVQTAAQRETMVKRFEHGREAAFKRLDTNNDGVIDAGERAAMRETAFARMDRNGDGFLTADEVPGRRGHHRAR